MRKTVILLLVSLVLCATIHAGSIYAKRNKQLKNLYADDTARRIGDIVTIVIVEDSKIDNKVSRDLNNSNSRSSDFNGEFDSSLVPDMPGFTMEAASSRQSKGQSDYKDERSFEDRITVVVEDVQPNGNLIVLGYRERDVAGDTQVIQVSGIIRPTDVAFDNTILSEQVANFHIVTINEGVSKSYNDPGWLSNIFDLLWPF